MIIHLKVRYKTNKESNDYLRRLWAIIRKKFGKMAWNYMPSRSQNNIFLGLADINVGKPVEFSLSYKERGCLDEIFAKDIQSKEIADKIENCLELAKNELEEKRYTFSYSIGRQCKFDSFNGKYFSVKGNTIKISIKGYDAIDAEYIFADRIQTVCAILSFYLLYPIVHKENCVNDILGFHKRTFAIKDYIAESIDAFLGRDYLYENDVALLESSMLVFTQGIIAEYMTRKLISVGYPYSETAIVNYMSALEVITTHDIEPTKCDICGQQKFSIAKRVMNLAIACNPDIEDRMKKWISGYYEIRSKYLHTGKRMSRNNYMGVSLPLMSIYNAQGAILQISVTIPSLKEDVRNMILFHENLPLIIMD